MSKGASSVLNPETARLLPRATCAARAHLVRPRLNTLTLFRTDATTGAARGFLGAHAVLPVLRNGTDRYALSGWFTLGDQKSG